MWEGSWRQQPRGDEQKDDRRRYAWDESAQDDKIHDSEREVNHPLVW